MAEVGRIINLGIKNLRKLGNGVVSGPTLEGNQRLLREIKDAGIKTIVDFRSNASPLFEKECKALGFDYFKFGLNQIACKERSMEIPERFVQKLKKLFEIMNKGDAYIGCQYGIDRTNTGILFNYFLNPKADRFIIPKILPATTDKCADICACSKKEMPSLLINTINRSLRKIQQILKRITPKERAELGIPENSKERFEKFFREKIGELIRINKNPKNYSDIIE